MDLYEGLQRFVPFNEQEVADRAVLIELLQKNAPIWNREPVAHLSASAWVLSPAKDKILLAYHNLYNAWAWLGGHADGERDLAAVALREVREESGVQHARLLLPEIFSLETLVVTGHEKHGQYVPSHLHLNVTFLMEADDQEPLQKKEDENSAVKWFAFSEAETASSEAWMCERIYKKLNQKLQSLL